ncbi:MAG TPA: hypothetical protein VK395_06225 [Gemmataceae bacterium]|nr:hypothetical protein [Gemmataceae bacterium]
MRNDSTTTADAIAFPKLDASDLASLKEAHPAFGQTVQNKFLGVSGDIADATRCLGVGKFKGVGSRLSCVDNWCLWCQFSFRLPFTAEAARLPLMGRQPRFVADDLVYHTLNRGNNRRTVFFQAGDF